MSDLDGFVVLLREELGLEVTRENVGDEFEELPGWDSVHLLELLVLLERETGARLSLPDVLDAPSLRSVFELAVGAS